MPSAETSRENLKTFRIIRLLERIVPWRTARLMYALLWPLGLIISGVGLVGDREGYWVDHGFLLNLASALAGFCFGVPVVVSLLRRVGERIEEEQIQIRESTAEATRSLVEQRRLEEVERAKLSEDRKKFSLEEVELRKSIARDRAEMEEKIARDRAEMEAAVNRNRAAKAEEIARDRAEMEAAVNRNRAEFLEAARASAIAVTRIHDLAIERTGRLGVERGQIDIDKEMIGLTSQLLQDWSVIVGWAS